MKQSKVTVIGAGNVGATAAQRLAEKNIANVVMLDVMGGIAAGKALDLMEARPVELHDRTIFGGDDYSLSKDSDVVLMTAGLARKPGMSRDDLLAKNAQIVSTCIEEAYKYSPNAIFIVVSNPVDAMTQLTHQILSAKGVPNNKIIGMAGVLDSSRMAFFIAEALDVSVRNIQPCVLGGHGDDMVPIARYTTVAGIPLPELLSSEKVAEIIKRTQNGGIEIVNLLQTGSAFYAPASSSVEMIDAILHDKKQILPCSCYLSGQYGVSGVFVGVPAKLGVNGIEEILELKLTAQELTELKASSESVRKNVARMQELINNAAAA
ncbi:MAG: malate dehydrogenase [Candidatus Caenarcaniphilales bacterium]|jgi:malate dehydrogenase|nr:malate dehydrogenase [Candidatus Caenarcaniphilales bacterium]